MTINLTDTSEHFLTNLGTHIASAHHIANLVTETNNTIHTASTTGPRGFVQIELTDPTNTHYGLFLAIADNHHDWNLRSDTTNNRITIYVEHGNLASSITAAQNLITKLATNPTYEGLDIWSAPVNEATAEGQF